MYVIELALAPSSLYAPEVRIMSLEAMTSAFHYCRVPAVSQSDIHHVVQTGDSF